MTYSLSGATFITPHRVAEGALAVRGEKIVGFGEAETVDLPLTGAVVAPAFINAHDHLLGSYWPKIGHGPYNNWREWDDDLKASPLYAERSKIANEDLYLIGSYRNLIAGTLTVSDHIPHKVNDPFIPNMPIRIIKDYALSHEVSSYDLKWGDGPKKEHARAIENDIPYITHIEEGFDEESKKGIDKLLRMNALSDHTVLIHGIALSAKDIAIIAKKQAHLVWCPASNWFMFNKTGNIAAWRKAGINVSLGTDSPMSGGENILEEMRFAQKLYPRLKSDGALTDNDMVMMTTVHPAQALRLPKLGALEKNFIADIIAVDNRDGGDGYHALVNASLKDIRLVIRSGVPVYGDADFAPFFEHCGISFHHCTVEGKAKICRYDMKALLLRVRKAVGFPKEIPFLPVE